MNDKQKEQAIHILTLVFAGFLAAGSPTRPVEKVFDDAEMLVNEADRRGLVDALTSVV